MKTIRITHLALLNFKGIRSLEIDFDEKETNIYGANAAGKTTVFDAVCWVLFGKDSQGRKDFNIKTLDSDGEPIERLPHSVSLSLAVDGEEIQLRKDYTELWTKKRGSVEEVFTGHEAKCFYNDVPLSVKEYTAKIAEICDEQVFKLITSPFHFTSLKKDAQRAMLMDLAGGVSEEDIIAENPDFYELTKWLAGKTAEEFSRELSSKKKTVREGISTIPARIDERRRSMPEECDWPLIENEIKTESAALADIDRQIEDRCHAYDAAAQQQDKVLKQIWDLRSQITAGKNSIKRELDDKYNEACRAQDAAIDKIMSFKNERRLKAITLPGLQQELDNLKSKRERLLSEWKFVKAQTFTEPDDEDFVCPTCHRPLEVDDVAAKIEEMRVAFNENRAIMLEHNKALGIETKTAIEAKEKELKDTNDKIFRLDSGIAELENSEVVKREIKKPDYDAAIAADDNIRQLEKQTADWQQQLDSLKASASAPDVSGLKAQKSAIQSNIDGLKQRLAAKDAITAANKRIAELEAEYRARQAELAQLEGMEYTVAQFVKARTAKVESSINGLFKLVRFKLYEKQINGGETETCEAMVDGVPFSDLNSAARINAGLDIINAFSASTGITAPVFVDNRESVTTLIGTKAQLVNLIVDGNCKQLKIN